MFIIIQKNTNIVLYASNTEITLGDNFTNHNDIKYADINTRFCNQIEVDSIPLDFRSKCYTYIEGIWAKTEYGVAKDTAISIEETEEQIEQENNSNISNDPLLNLLKTKPFSEIETYIENQFSNLASMTNIEIDTYIENNVIDLSSAKDSLKIIAKDVARTMKIVKLNTKLSVYLLKNLGE